MTRLKLKKKRKVSSWILSSFFSISIWSFAQKDIQSIFPAIKGYRKALNTLEPVAIYLSIVFILFALILTIVGARDSRPTIPSTNNGQNESKQDKDNR